MYTAELQWIIVYCVDVRQVADYLHNTEQSGSAVGLSFFGIFLRYYHHVLAAK